MYSWLWRVLPGGAVLKGVQCLVLFLLVVLVLFTVVFPAVEPLLPYGDVTVDDAGTPAA